MYFGMQLRFRPELLKHSANLRYGSYPVGRRLLIPLGIWKRSASAAKARSLQAKQLNNPMVSFA